MTNKTLPQTSGIYQIHNLITGKLYIGSTINFRTRWYDHLKLLRKNKHHSPRLQNSWNKHGESNFVFEILLYCEPKNLLFYEQRAIDTYDSYNNGYNSTLKAGNTLGIKKPPLTEEQRKAKSIVATGKPHPISEEARQRLIERNKNRVWTDEAKEKIIKAHKGSKRSEECKQKMSDDRKGRNGTPHTIETKERLSQIAKTQNRTISPENQTKMQEALKNVVRTISPEKQAKMIEARKAAFAVKKLADPNYKQVNKPHPKRKLL